MELTKPRATFEETLAFANAVRKAGGGNPLDALMPAVPADASQCLIARNLNFNCRVDCCGKDEGWLMYVADPEIAKRIAASLDLEVDADESDESETALLLPPEIGKVAGDFDEWEDAARNLRTAFDLDDEEQQLLDDFSPYVEASVREAHSAGTITEEGKLLL